ncbi:MAG TPA: hypothetical protein VK126_05890 [Nitrososphaerales archaeon]|nr:hypothetical protein [Nitrososphaerales archaeon]
MASVAKDLLLLIEGFTALLGLYVGYEFITQPSGTSLGLSLSILSSFPIRVQDFYYPGLWIFVVYGLGFALVTYSLLSGRRGSWAVALVLCLVWLVGLTFVIIYMGPNTFSEALFVPQVVSLILLVGARRQVSARGA